MHRCKDRSERYQNHLQSTIQRRQNHKEMKISTKSSLFQNFALYFSKNDSGDFQVHQPTQGIYNRPGIKCKNGCLEIASQIIDRFYFVDQIFARFFLLDESCIYSAHVGT